MSGDQGNWIDGVESQIDDAEFHAGAETILMGWITIVACLAAFCCGLATYFFVERFLKWHWGISVLAALYTIFFLQPIFGTSLTGSICGVSQELRQLRRKRRGKL